MSEVEIKEEKDILIARQAAREAAQSVGFGIVDQTRLITAVSELTRNAYKYAGGGRMTLKKIEKDRKNGLMVTVIDWGPGIANIRRAMEDGYTTGDGFGNGLGGAKRLVDEFTIHSKVGKGTKIVIIKWQH
ncbi:MAG: anti-sigma regulatory factor [bacterium]